MRLDPLSFQALRRVVSHFPLDWKKEVSAVAEDRYPIEITAIHSGKFVGFQLGMFSKETELEPFNRIPRSKRSLALSRMIAERRVIVSTPDGSPAEDGRFPGRFLLGDFTVTHNSQMLQAVNAISPRGVYVCGTYASSRGLTVSLNREAGTSDYALEAGALVLGDQGVCCLDEFDKMDTSEHQSLLEAMEQQSISIAKAGVVCSLPARTSVIAAANPVGGHYSKGKTVSENLKMPAPLLSRFDLVFILIDRPDETKDRLLSDHIMALHRDAGLGAPGKRKGDDGDGGGRAFSGAASSQKGGPMSDKWDTAPELLEQRLRPTGEEHVPPPLLRKYIGYARKYVHPKLTEKAKELLKAFYLELREKHRSDDTTPVTNRQLESLIRLTEARAKAELRTEACKADARDAIAIMRGAIGDGVFGSGPSCIDFRQATPGSGVRSSKARVVTQFVGVLTAEAKKRSSSVFSFKELSAFARDKGFAPVMGDLTEFIDLLNLQGFLLKSAGGNYRLSTF